jgi:hypothetical protein
MFRRLGRAEIDRVEPGRSEQQLQRLAPHNVRRMITRPTGASARDAGQRSRDFDGGPAPIGASSTRRPLDAARFNSYIRATLPN